MKYYSSAKGNNPRLMYPTTKWLNLKYIVLSERRQTKKPTYHMSPCMWHSEKCKIIGTENSGSQSLQLVEELPTKVHKAILQG